VNTDANIGKVVFAGGIAKANGNLGNQAFGRVYIFAKCVPLFPKGIQKFFKVRQKLLGRTTACAVDNGGGIFNEEDVGMGNRSGYCFLNINGAWAIA